MKFSCLSLVAIASVATADDTTGGNLRSSAASLERHLGGPNENGPCNGICNAFENACDNDCEGGGGNGKGCTKLCAAALSFECTCSAAPTCSDLTTVGALTSEWDSDSCRKSAPVIDTDPKCPDDYTVQCLTDGLFPICGTGQVPGDFTLLQEGGIEVGIRATKRTDGPVAPTDGDGVGVYQVAAGIDAEAAALWNIDIHADLTGVTETFGDYSSLEVTAKCIGGTCGSFGTYSFFIYPVFPYPDYTALAQTSQNPTFGFWPWNSQEFDPNAEATYEFCLILNGGAATQDLCPVCMQVVAA